MTIFRYSAASLTLLLVGCEDQPNMMICEQSPGFITSANDSGGQEIVVHQCITKWGYRLSRSQGANSEIAQATVGACRDALDKFLALKVDDGNRTKQPFTADLWAQFTDRFKEEAMFRVTQGRAGDCPDRSPSQK